MINNGRPIIVGYNAYDKAHNEYLQTLIFHQSLKDQASFYFSRAMCDVIQTKLDVTHLPHAIFPVHMPPQLFETGGAGGGIV